MEYQKIANLLNDGSNKPSKFRTRNWVEINDESRGTYSSNDINFKTTMPRSNLCNYANAYILVKGTITITSVGDNDAVKRLNERNKGVIFKNCAPITKCIIRINNIEIDNAQVIDIVVPIYNLIEYSDNYSKTSGSFWQFYKDDSNDTITQFELLKSKTKITGKNPGAGNTRDVEIIVPLKYLRNFWRTFKMPLINCEVNLILTWSLTYVISSVIGETKFKITATNFIFQL